MGQEPQEPHLIISDLSGTQQRVRQHGSFGEGGGCLELLLWRAGKMLKGWRRKGLQGHAEGPLRVEAMHWEVSRLGSSYSLSSIAWSLPIAF